MGTGCWRFVRQGLGLGCVVLTTAMLAAQKPPAGRPRLYFVAGQSNAQGNAKLDGLSGAQRQPLADVWFWTGERFEPLVPGTTKTSARIGEFGPELGLVRGLRDDDERGRIYVAKFYRSGQGLHAGIDGNEWRGSAPGPDRATFYPGLQPGDPNVGWHYAAWLPQARAALAAFVAAEPTGAVGGVAWMQGEQDAKHEVAAREYADSLRLLRRRFGEDLGRVDAAWGEPPWVYGQVLPAEPPLPRFGHRDVVRERMAALDERAQTGAAQRGMRMVPTEDCSLSADRVHYDAQGQWQLGLSFARELLAMRDPVWSPPWCELRHGLGRSRLALAKGRARVAFLGGSITHNPGWREQVCEWLASRWPATELSFVNAGIPSMGSTPGAFRVARDVLAQGRVDLLFVEAAVNDSTNGRSALEQRRAMEGIVRHVRAHSPACDVVFLYFADPDKVASYDRGTMPAVIRNHEAVAAHYGVPSLDLAREVRDRIARGEFTWAEGMRDLHPSPFGQELYAAGVRRFLEDGWGATGGSAKHPYSHSLPSPLEASNYEAGDLLPPSAATAATGFVQVPSWHNEVGGGTRAGFVDVPMLVGERPGDAFALAFEGRAVGLFVAAGPDAGIVEYRLDGGEWRRQDLFTAWSKALHLPWLYVLDADLAPGPHRLEVRIAEDRNPASRGHACRIAHFAVNGSAPQSSR